MNFRKKQKGLGLMGLIASILGAGFVLLYGSQIGLAYIDKNTVKGAVKAALLDSRSNDTATPSSIKSAIMKKVSMGDTGLMADNLTVYTRSGSFVVDVKMEKIIEVTSDISILVSFDFSEESQ